jgi:Zn ribbon nucleic-acid-binding protein
MDAAEHALHCGAAAPLDETQQSYSLTYSEIGVRLCQCVECGSITAEQAQEIGNHFFPVRSNDHGMDPIDQFHIF